MNSHVDTIVRKHVIRGLALLAAFALGVVSLPGAYAGPSKTEAGSLQEKGKRQKVKATNLKEVKALCDAGKLVDVSGIKASSSSSSTPVLQGSDCNGGTGNCQACCYQHNCVSCDFE